MQKLMTSQQVADLLQVSVETVRDWTRAGLLPVIRFRGPFRRYDYDAVMAAVRLRQADSVPPPVDADGLRDVAQHGGAA